MGRQAKWARAVSILAFGLLRIACMGSVAIPTELRAQELLLTRDVPIVLDSGPQVGPATEFRLVWSDVIDAGGDAPWLSIHLETLQLEGESLLRITSMEDGDVQVLDGRNARPGGWSATRNGAAVLLELLAGPSDRCRVVVNGAVAGVVPMSLMSAPFDEEIVGGPGDDPPQPQGICGLDSRVPSHHPAVARLRLEKQGGGWSVCTAWMTDRPLNDLIRIHPQKVFASAGHCFVNSAGVMDTISARVEFNVPASTPACGLRSPPSRDQYEVDLSSLQFECDPVPPPTTCRPGFDWATFDVRPSEQQFAYFRQGRATLHVPAFGEGLAASAGSSVVAIGHGKDRGDGIHAMACGDVCVEGSRHLVQQKDGGLVSSVSGRQVRFSADTCAGASGGPVVTPTASQAVGIITHSDCEVGGTNHAMRTDDPAFQRGLRRITVARSNRPPLLGCAAPRVATAEGTCRARVRCEDIAWCSDPDGTTPTLTCLPSDTYDFDGGLAAVDVSCSDGVSSVALTCPVEIVDEEAPAISCPPTLVIECTQAGGVPLDQPDMASWLAGASADDNCTVASLTHDAPTLVPAGCPPGASTSVRFTAADSSGRQTACSATVIVEDTTAPAFVGSLPPSATVHCDEVSVAPTLSADDACDPDVDVLFAEVRRDGPCPDSYDLRRTWSTEDDCGNLTRHVQDLEVIDIVPPEIVGIFADLVVECDRVPSPAVVTVRDGCDDDPSLTFLQEVIDGPCPGAYEILRTWTATDRCANTSRATRRVSVVDTTPPTIVPTSGDVHCSWPPDHRMRCFRQEDFSPSIADNCSEPVTWRFARCVSDQPDDGTGDGSTSLDCVVSADGRELCVRSERDGSEPSGRRYSVGIVAMDACGNESEVVEIGRIHVPHGAPGAGCRRPSDG